MADIDLSTRLTNGLTLRDPFWVASSHLTQPSMLKIWTDIAPAALTLKTATLMDRNEPGKIPGGNRPTLDVLPRYGRSYYCDGLKTDEFHTYEECRDQLTEAKRILPDTKVGISVLATKFEKFSDLKGLTTNADFAELNLKYSMRVAQAESYFSALSANWSSCMEIIAAFLETFSQIPVFVKIPRELSWLPEKPECRELVELLAKYSNSGVIVANSRKTDIAKFIYEGEEHEFHGGVMTGDVLYDETIALIERFRNELPRSVPIVATGGMVDEQQVLMAMRAGANAVQLCTAFTYYKPGYYRTLVSGLKARIKWRGVSTSSEFMDRLTKEGVASIYSMPFVYYTAFWGDDLQKQIRLDMKYSDRMDAVIMSGQTLTENWKDALDARVTNHKSIQFLLPNPNGEIFGAIQRSWGIVNGQLDEMKNHVTATKARLEKLFSDHNDDLTSEEKKTVQWRVKYYDRCPFYSFYLFDDKVYLAQYPFHRPGRLASPVYVFFRSSPEYDRLDKEWQGLETSTRLVKQE